MVYRDDCGDIGLGGMAVLVTTGALVCLVLGSVIVSDYNRVDAYESRHCSGTLISSDIHLSGVKCARGKAVTQFGKGTNVSQYNQTVELFYPPVNWLIVCKKAADIDDWLSGMASATTFSCLVDNPSGNTGLPDGVRSNYDSIGGWIAMLVLAVLFFVSLFVLLGYLAWDAKCRRK